MNVGETFKITQFSSNIKNTDSRIKYTNVVD